MPPAGFEPTILAGERPKTYALDGAATGTGLYTSYRVYILVAFGLNAGPSAPALVQYHVLQTRSVQAL